MAKQAVNQIMRTDEAARYIGFAKSTLDTWRSRGTGPRYSRIGRIPVYTRDDLDEFVAEHRVGGGR